GCNVTSIATPCSAQRSYRPEAVQWRRSLQLILDGANANFGWSQSFPMSCKSQAHEALGLFFAQEGVLPKMIMDNAKEMKLGEFDRKCKKATPICPISPWPNSTKHEIRELKKGAARNLICSDVPRQLWCYALEYKSYVCSHTAHDINKLDGCVPETVVLGKTADISPFCEFGFWDFLRPWVAFPENPLVLGKYLGPSIDVGPAMMQHVMKANGKVEDCSTVRQLTPKDKSILPCRRSRRHY
ncbi:LOW QUALITY PROTEIN: hypothetical protein ACHAW6_001643, partial [Cyclotella cf. meneghiniana]